MGDGTYMGTVNIVSPCNRALTAHMHLTSMKDRMVATAIREDTQALCMECRRCMVMPEGFARHWECFRDSRKAEKSCQQPP